MLHLAQAVSYIDAAPFLAWRNLAVLAQRGLMSLGPRTQAKHTEDRYSCVSNHFAKDTLPEWSKGVDSSSTSASCVGSNPTGVTSASICQHRRGGSHCNNALIKKNLQDVCVSSCVPCAPHKLQSMINNAYIGRNRRSQ